MNLPLSKRLLACCGMVYRGDRIADIGCDHGYLSIYLLREGIASSVIAADINEMPLRNAIQNAERYGVKDRIQFYLSDGAKNIPRDFDTLICAGMGADTIISILDAAPWLQNCKYRLILQCQSKPPTLRKYLSDKGWYILEETVLRDGRFLYTVMSVNWEPGHTPITPGQQYFSPALLASPAHELPEYYQKILYSLSRAINGRGDGADPQMVAAYEELNNNPALQWLKEEQDGNC